MELPLTISLLFVSQSLFRFLPPASHPTTFELANNPSLLTISMSLLAAAVLAPIFEEICFRGVLAPALGAKTRSAIGAFVLNGFLFAIIHPTGIPAWPSLAAIGGMAAFLAYQRGSIVPSIVMHCAHNLLITLVAISM